MRFIGPQTLRSKQFSGSGETARAGSQMLVETHD
jgi:hypothetical protein